MRRHRGQHRVHPDAPTEPHVDRRRRLVDVASATSDQSYGECAYLCLIGLIFVVINLVVDLLYYLVDPPLRFERTSAAGAH